MCRWFCFMFSIVSIFGQSRAEGPTLVVENVQVIVGDGTVLKGVSVAVSGDRIQKISEITQAAGAAQIIDGTGKSLMPGLIDTHIHLFAGSRGCGERAFREELRADIPGKLKEYLRAGVTTIKSTGDPLSLILELREHLEEGQVVGPRLVVVGPGITAPGGHPAVTILKNDDWWRTEHSREVADVASGKEVVRQLAEHGVDATKVVHDGGPFAPGGQVFAKMSPDVMKAVIDEAHQHGLRATVHTWRESDAIAALKAGADGLEHGVVDGRLNSDRLCNLLVMKHAFYVPTLRILEFVGADAVANGKYNLKRIWDNDGQVALGTDTFTMEGIDPPPGENTLMELELMSDAGMSPEAIIRSATHDAARHLGRLDDLGTIEEGKIADFLVLEESPLNDISAIRNTVCVVQSGKVIRNRSLKR